MKKVNLSRINNNKTYHRGLLILAFLTLLIFVGLYTKRIALAFDASYFLQSECKDVAGHSVDTPSIDQCSTGGDLCGVKQCRNCKISVAGPDPGNLFPIPIPPNLISIFLKFASVPAYTCVAAPPSAAIPLIVSTEIGKINTEPQNLIQTFVRIFTGLAGGICLLLLLSGAVKYLTSSGNPETVEEAKGIITHALGGFLLVFLSVFLLKLIGIDVLGIPGLTPSGGGFTTP